MVALLSFTVSISSKRILQGMLTFSQISLRQLAVWPLSAPSV